MHAAVLDHTEVNFYSSLCRLVITINVFRCFTEGSSGSPVSG